MSEATGGDGPTGARETVLAEAPSVVPHGASDDLVMILDPSTSSGETFRTRRVRLAPRWAVLIVVGVLALVSAALRAKSAAAGFQTEDGAATWVKLLPATLLVLIATGDLVLLWSHHHFETDYWDDCSSRSTSCSVDVDLDHMARLTITVLRVLAMSGVVAGAWWFLRDLRLVTRHYRKSLDGETRRDQGGSVVTYPWHQVRDVFVRRLGWRRSRALLATPAPSVTLTADPAMVSTYSSRLKAFHIVDLGGHALPVSEVLSSMERHQLAQQDGTPTIAT